VNELLVPDFEEPDVPIVIPEPDAESDTEPVQTPATKAEVLIGLIVPEDPVKVLVPVKLVTVLPFESLAVIVMLKAEPAVCGLLIVLKTKWSRAAGLTVSVLLVPDLLPPLVEIEMPVPA
jgi:hypothetical protein